MSERKERFTPGPWHKRGKKVFWAKPERDLPKDNLLNGLVCICATAEDNPPEVIEEARANAALIAAAPEMYNDEKDKIVHLQTLKNQIRCLLAPKKDTVVTLDFVLKYIDEIIGDTENLLAKARGEATK